MGKEKDIRHVQHVRQSVTPASSANESFFQISRQGFGDTYAASMQMAMEARRKHKILETHNNVVEDLTPPLLDDDFIVSKLMKLNRKLYINELEAEPIVPREHPTITSRVGNSARFNWDESLSVFLSSNYLTSGEEDSGSDEEYSKWSRSTKTPPFIRIVLRKNAEILFFDQQSKTALRGSVEAHHVDNDNQAYDYNTLGKGRMRRTTIAESQTAGKLYKTRETNTQMVRTDTNKSYVSNYLMFKSFNITPPIKGDSPPTKNKKPIIEKHDIDEILHKNEFKVAMMKTLRILAGNVFEKQQRRFRYIKTPNTMALDKEFKYNFDVLLQFNPQSSDRHRRSIADLAFCPGNGDIIAAAYGIYSFGYMHVPEDGFCCVWNIKNPVNPERKYYFTAPVVSVQFSYSTPQLLAIGLYDGTVQIRDISSFSETPVAVSLHDITATWDPITSIEWIPPANVAGAEHFDIEPLLALSQDGSVIKYRIINSPYLLAFKQMQLDRIEGAPEGLHKKRIWNQTQSNRFPQGLKIIRHPNQHDIYYVLSDEGCIHKCSTNYPHQHLEVLQAHIGSVNDMDFSPWSPKLFLTCGNDWCIRIWLDGILEPLITLKHKIGPIHSAAWSKTHSTVIISNTRSAVEIWDIRRGTLKPVSSSQIDKAILTMFKFSRCGRSMAVGNEKGSVLIIALDDMPFTPHFQYDELELAIYKCLGTNTVLINELKSIGFFGYPEQNTSRGKKTQCTLIN